MSKELVPEQQEIDVVKLFKLFFLKPNITIILICGFTFLTVGVSYALYLPDKYTSKSVLASSSSDSVGLGALGRQYGAFASLAGVNLTSGQNNLQQHAVEVISSWGFIEKFIAQRNIAIPLFAAEGWNKKTNKLKIDDDLYDTELKKWVRKPKPSIGRAAKPSSWELYEAFTEIFFISTDKKTDFITIGVTFYSPFLAKQWVDWLMEDINLELRRRSLQEIEKNIIYLEEQIENTNKNELQAVFFNLIEEQLKSQMLAKANFDFVFKTLNKAMVPEEKSSPQRALIVIIFGIMGGFFALVYVAIKNRDHILSPIS